MGDDTADAVAYAFRALVPQMPLPPERPKPEDVFHDFLVVLMMKKRQLEYRAERECPEYIDFGGEA